MALTCGGIPWVGHTNSRAVTPPNTRSAASRTAAVTRRRRRGRRPRPAAGAVILPVMWPMSVPFQPSLPRQSSRLARRARVTPRGGNGAVSQIGPVTGQLSLRQVSSGPARDRRLRPRLPYSVAWSRWLVQGPRSGRSSGRTARCLSPGGPTRSLRFGVNPPRCPRVSHMSRRLFRRVWGWGTCLAVPSSLTVGEYSTLRREVLLSGGRLPTGWQQQVWTFSALSPQDSSPTRSASTARATG